MNERILNRVSYKLENEVKKGVDIASGVYHVSNFYQWIWTTMAMANTDAMFGETTNPFRKPGILQKYWTWEQEHLNILYAPFLPWLTARKAYNARASVLSALTDFANTIGDAGDNSILTKNCQNLNKEHDVHGGEAATIYLALVFGATANAFPTLYWMLLFVFRDPGLLRDLRAELESSGIVSEEDVGQGPSPSRGVRVVEAGRITATSCPLLLSCYTETLRLVSRHPGARVVTADPAAALSFRDGRTGEQRSYALNKGSIVHMPAGMLHSSERHWGPDAAHFDGYRFMRLDRAADRQARKAHIALGGGKHLCPGRHMAFAEIMATVAVFVAGFELETTHADLPDMVHQFGLGIVKPDEANDLSASIRPRRDAQNVTWKFRV
ncbi:putative cytochrome p450 [Diaporthe ampelina]|uniref:Putative cytochrome p450 n=1 Tax=Diaporthe ampelina TaxID=1214573 RepID=A0A0G2FED4_9PEZI|nr:putative cytochrome p450 [Diaporthe ampelina]